MSRRIPLPNYTRKPDSPVHPFPHQISMRALDLLQGATFYPAFVDVAVGIYKDRTADFMKQMHDAFIAGGMSQAAWEISTDSLANYLEYLPSPIMQSAVIAGLSHWDWYVGKLGRFIEFARQHDDLSPEVVKSTEQNLTKIPLCSFADQIHILKETSGNVLQIPDDDIGRLNEMILVRNLGVHSQWEVTFHYLKSTKTVGWSIGDVRDVEMDEFEAWRMALYNLIINTSHFFANRYSQVPDFDPYKPS